MVAKVSTIPQLPFAEAIDTDTFHSIVGVSNQLSWISIGIASLRFRAGLAKQGKTHLLPYRNWTYPFGPWFVIILNSFLVLVQGWTCFSPSFVAVDFVSFYIELPIMLFLFVGWKLFKRTKLVKLEEMDLETDIYTIADKEELDQAWESSWKGKAKKTLNWLF